MTDPFDESVGYEVPNIRPDVITESHQHFDHCAHSLIKGYFKVIEEPGEYEVAGYRIRGYRTFHDKEHGALRGTNIIFDILTPEGFRIVHCGDLGHYPSSEVMEKLAGADILLVPVGGIYTISGSVAAKMVREIAPVIAVPMHYSTPVLKFKLDPVETFLDYFDNVERAGEIEVTRVEPFRTSSLRITVLDYR